MGSVFPLVRVPNVIGLGIGQVQSILAAVPLRNFVTRIPGVSAGGGGAISQDPRAGQTVSAYSVVRVRCPDPFISEETELGVDGPQPAFSPQQGFITSVSVTEQGADIGLSVQGLMPFSYHLYSDVPATREVYMRRGAMLAIAQRAFTGQDLVRVDFAGTTVESIQIFRPVVEQPFPFP
jgi:hypothetical protein